MLYGMLAASVILLLMAAVATLLVQATREEYYRLLEEDKELQMVECERSIQLYALGGLLLAAAAAFGFFYAGTLYGQ